MAKRLLAVIDSTDADGPYKARARVYRDTEWEEWRVRYYHGDELLSYMGEESDSFHNDQADAMGTAELQVKALAKRDLTSVWLPDEHDGLTERDPRRARKKYEDNPDVRELRPKSLDNFKALAKQSGYTVKKTSNARLGDYYLAYEGEDDCMGSFCPKYPRDAFLLTRHGR